MTKYNPSEIEPKWQKIWDETKLYQAEDFSKRPKYYMLTEFPYLSGVGIHVGHTREYTLGDVMARYRRMLGHNVLYPMGYDAFGLPTENFAIKNKISPQAATKQNEATFKRELRALGLGVDWQREINTTDPAYYRWTQWLFLQFFKAGLAYQAEIAINWCPHCKTGLANEEVVNGRHERCGTPVEKKQIKQWLLKITAYADRLIDGLKTVDYPERIASQQINWIGKSQGTNVKFQIEGSKEAIEVFTTRVDTIYSATFLVLAPEHPLVSKLTQPKQKTAIETYVKKVQSESDLDRQAIDRPKTGVFTGSYVINPANGDKLPIWIADFVLLGYGTGAVFGDAHDERDTEFATKFKIPLKTSLEPVTGTPQKDPEYRQSIVALVRNPKTNQVLSINWGPKHGGNLLIGGGVDGQEDPLESARREVAEETGYTDLKLLATSETIHHHYFAHSKNKARQIDVTAFYFELASDKQIKPRLEADEQDKFQVEWLDAEAARSKITDQLHAYVLGKFHFNQPFTGDGILYNSGQFDGLTSAEARNKITAWLESKDLGGPAVQYKLRDWIFSRQHYWGEPIPIIHCPKCGPVPVPEKDLPVELPEVEHYEPTETGESPLAAMTDWVNVSCPKCSGPAKRETDTMPNWAGSSWYYLRYLDPHNAKTFADPAKLEYWGMVDLYLGGMEHTTLHLLYSRFWHHFLYDQKLVPTPEPYAARRGQGIVLADDNRKMSKSIGNVVNPTEIIKHYGADVLRIYIIFMAPYDETTAWSDARIAGVSRFVRRFWDFNQKLLANDRSAGQPDGALGARVDRIVHQTLKKVHEDIENMKFNTLVSALMVALNELTTQDIADRLVQPANSQLSQRTARLLILMIAPAAPHLAEELWHQLGEAESVHVQPWPEYDPELIKAEVFDIAIQVNGKFRGTVTVPVEADEAAIIAAAKEQASVKKYLAGHKVAKTITVPRKLVNFVLK